MKCRYVGSKYMHFMTANMGRGDGQPGVSGGKSILSCHEVNGSQIRSDMLLDCITKLLERLRVGISERQFQKRY